MSQAFTEFIQEGESGSSFERGHSTAPAEAMHRFAVAAEMTGKTSFERTTEVMATDTIEVYSHV